MKFFLYVFTYFFIYYFFFSYFLEPLVQLLLLRMWSDESPFFFLSDVVVQRKSAVKCSFQCSSFLAFCWHNMVIIIIVIIPYGMYIYLYACMYVCMSESYFSISTNSSLLIEHWHKYIFICMYVCMSVYTIYVWTIRRKEERSKREFDSSGLRARLYWRIKLFKLFFFFFFYHLSVTTGWKKERKRLLPPWIVLTLQWSIVVETYFAVLDDEQARSRRRWWWWWWKW